MFVKPFLKSMSIQKSYIYSNIGLPKTLDRYFNYKSGLWVTKGHMQGCAIFRICVVRMSVTIS